MSVGDGRLVLQLAAPGRLTFYDWEADVLLPSGRTDASQLSGDRYVDQLALTLSQGADATGPGSAREGAGAMTLYRAVALAARGPHDRTAAGRPTLYRFARAASLACAALARDDGAARIGEVTESGHCLVAGPASTVAQLRAELPAGIAPDAGRQLTVGPGRTVLAAESPGAVPVATASSAARFYVLRDRPALSGRELTDVRAKTSETGEPGVGFGFTAAGAHAFRDLTATIAHRGRQVTLGSDQLYQHFAIALDGRLVSVPSIDFTQYPDGILPAGERWWGDRGRPDPRLGPAAGRDPARGPDRCRADPGVQWAVTGRSGQPADDRGDPVADDRLGAGPAMVGIGHGEDDPGAGVELQLEQVGGQPVQMRRIAGQPAMDGVVGTGCAEHRPGRTTHRAAARDGQHRVAGQAGDAHRGHPGHVAVVAPAHHDRGRQPRERDRQRGRDGARNRGRRRGCRRGDGGPHGREQRRGSR